MPGTTELVPWLRPYADYLLRVAAYNDLHPSITSVYRGPAKQAVLYQRYQEALRRGETGVIPAAPPGTSMHEKRLALDVVVKQGWRSTQQEALGRFWISMGGVWSPRDPVHFTVNHP